MIGKAGLPVLKQLCEEKDIKIDPGDRVADLRLKLRKWHAGQGDAAETKEKVNGPDGDEGFELVNVNT